MNRYSYKAVNDEGKYVRGKLSAENPAELLTMLRSTKLELISYKTEKLHQSFNLFDRIKTKDLIMMFVHLEQLDKAGVPILESIAELKDNADSLRVRNLAHEIHDAIVSGSLFSESLAKHPHIFNPVYVGLIAAGEKTGRLAATFNNIVEDLKWSTDLKRKTRRAILGPMFGIFLIIIVLSVMMGIVVPRVTSFLMMQNIELPTLTRALIGFSEFMKSYWLPFILFFPAMFLLIKLLSIASQNFAIRIDAIKLRIPLIGPILSKLDIAKFCQFFAMTFKSGLGVIECLESASLVISNKAVKQSIALVKQQVSSGQSLTKSLAQTGYFPSLVTRMFKVGEDSGNMEDSLMNIKFFYDREINDSIEGLVSLIQPALTMVMGGMIAWITMAVFGPIYSSFSALK